MKNKLIITLIVVAFIIILGMYLALNKPANDTPENTYNTFIKAVNDPEPEVAADMTIWKFAPQEEYDELVDTYSEIGLFYQIETHELTVIHSQDMAPDYKLEMENITQKYENDYNITIQDYCYLNMSRTLNYYNGNTEYWGYSNMGCLQVDELWYLCRFDYYGTEQS